MNNRLTESSRSNEPSRLNEPWIERAVALLDESTDALDAATLSRLNRARQAALAQRRPALSGWMMGTGFAGAALALAIALGFGQHPALSPVKTPVSMERVVEADALVGDDNLDLYENLDFYAWLDAQQQDGNG